MSTHPLARLLARDADHVAPRLLGHRLLRRDPDGVLRSGRIVEVEAYTAPEDLGSHARLGRRTARNEPMYARPGIAYVYFTYGMHFCMNVVCAPLDRPHAVLLRALAPLQGLDAMRQGRRLPPDAPDSAIASGPAKLCQALAISREHNNLDLLNHDSPLQLQHDPAGRRWALAHGIDRSARIGLSRTGPNGAGPWCDAPLRWFVRDCPHVTRP